MKVNPITHSQFGEDLIFMETLSRIGTTNKWCFEVGAHDGSWLSNTLRFRNQGWDAVLMEREIKHFKVLKEDYGETATCVYGEVFSLDHTLNQTAIPEFPDIGVIDIDGDDYWLWKAMIFYRPRILCIEFNPYDTQPGYDEFIPAAPGSGQTARLPTIALGEEKGYSLVGETFCNLIFVDNKCNGKTTS